MNWAGLSVVLGLLVLAGLTLPYGAVIIVVLLAVFLKS